MNQVKNDLQKNIIRLADGRQLIYYNFQTPTQTVREAPLKDLTTKEDKENHHV